MAAVEITELAQADLVDVWTYIAIDNANAADHVLDVIDVDCCHARGVYSRHGDSNSAQETRGTDRWI